MAADVTNRRTGPMPAQSAAAPADRRATPEPRSAARITTSIPAGQTLAVRMDHVVEAVVQDQNALRRTLPDVAAEVLEMCSRNKGDAGTIERTLTRDPFISAQIVSIANSALFAPRMPILGVRDAVVRIGLDSVRDLVLMVVTNSTMFRVRGFDTVVEEMRRRMLAAASAARLLARAVRAESEYGFLAGLLHNIGELVLLERCVNDGVVNPGLWSDPVEGALARERIQAHHTAVGAAVCKSWKLPSGVVDAAQFHHDYKSGGQNHLAAHLVAVADIIVDYILPGTERPKQPVSDWPAVRELNLSADQMNTIVEQARAGAAGLIAAR